VRRLVFVTQRIDPGHPVLGSTLVKVRALAERVDELVVLAAVVVPGSLPRNCRARTFAAPTQALRGARFVAALARELVPRPLAVLAHMSPIYARLAAPLARPLGVPVLLWYTQWRTNPLLERTERVVDAVLTADAHSFPFASEKVRVIGHGIDVDEFECSEPSGRSRLQLLALGRYSPVKGYGTLVRAAATAELELAIHGSLETPADVEERAALERLVTELGAPVRVGGPVPRTEVHTLLAQADALVSNTRGGADKVVYEAAAACRPAFASAASFEELLPPELRFPVDDHAALAARLRELADRDAHERAELGQELRRRVEQGHSVDRWADQVLAAAALR
jgi:glycosyltransferase involved in cell wall biosynthesis